MRNRQAKEPLTKQVEAALFAGKEGDPVPAASQTLTERGQGPHPYLQIFRLRGLF